jgi:hypothetical protein
MLCFALLGFVGSIIIDSTGDNRIKLRVGTQWAKSLIDWKAQSSKLILPHATVYGPDLYGYLDNGARIYFDSTIVNKKSGPRAVIGLNPRSRVANNYEVSLSRTRKEEVSMRFSPYEALAPSRKDEEKPDVWEMELFVKDETVTVELSMDTHSWEIVSPDRKYISHIQGLKCDYSGEHPCYMDCELLETNMFAIDFSLGSEREVLSFPISKAPSAQTVVGKQVSDGKKLSMCATNIRLVPGSDRFVLGTNLILEQGSDVYLNGRLGTVAIRNRLIVA